MIIERIEEAQGPFLGSTQLGHGLRKPRIALMGEFSAGKSTLANLLAGGQHLPVQVTATQLPPVWMSYGTAPMYRVDLEGKSIPVSLSRLEDVPIAETAFVRMFEQSETLSHCDIIDMPGISDPNMSAKVWQRVLPLADGVVWCTHATQAWRQSESAIWGTVSPELKRRSLLLLTRIDKIVGEQDRARVVRRVNKETDGLFSAPCLTISLTQALATQNGSAAWTAAGATQLFDQLAQLVRDIRIDLGHPLPLKSDAEASAASPSLGTVLPRRIRSDMAQSGLTPRPALGALSPEVMAIRATMGRVEN
jgi:Dynamin family